MKFEISVGWCTPPRIDDSMFRAWLISLSLDNGMPHWYLVPDTAVVARICLLGFYVQFYSSIFWKHGEAD